MTGPQVLEKKLVGVGRRWIFGDCEYVELSRQLTVAGQLIKLESKPLDVLQLLLEQPTQVLSKDELIGGAWGTATTDQSLATAVSKLRRAFGGPRDRIILNVSGVGYRIAVPVLSVEDTIPELPVLRLQAGDAVPFREDWMIVRALGVGDPPSVWLAEHRRTHQAHVFKFAVDGVRLKALQREVALSRMLAFSFPKDPRFVRMLDWNFEQEPFFTETEFQGANLFEFAETEAFRQMPLEQRLALAREIVGAVAEAHGLGILHNDLKPSNILVRRSHDGTAPEDQTFAENWQVKVVDFGVASLSDPHRLLDLQITDHGQFSSEGEPQGVSSRVGTAMYRAPELREGGARPSVRADIYALGVILYQIVCGDFLEPPTFGWEARVPEPLLREDIAAAANVNPDLRLASATELADRLARFAARREERICREKERAVAARARMRRPWVILAMSALLAGLGASLWFYLGALKQRNAALAQSRTLQAMNDFLTKDLLAQSNPLLGPGSRTGSEITLVEALDSASTKIDQRFSQDPETSAAIHEAMGGALDARTHFDESAQQFGIAAERYREAEGPLSQRAIIAELRRENTQFRSQMPRSIEEARKGYAAQVKLISHLPSVTPELQARQAFTGTSAILYSSHPEEGLTLLDAAIKRAQASPGFDPQLLSAMQLRYCGIYLRMDKFAQAEKIARAALAGIDKQQGRDSPASIQPRFFLDEALYSQGRYKETLLNTAHDYPFFLRELGPENQMTAGVLDLQAQAEQAEDPKASIRDWLLIRSSAQESPAGVYLKGQATNLLAQLECQGGNIAAGVGYAQEAIRESRAKEGPKSLNLSIGSFALAECILDQQEEHGKGAGHGPDARALNEADRLLGDVDLSVTSQYPGLSETEGHVDVARGRLALLRGQTSLAKEYATKARPFLQGPNADRYERSMLSRLTASLESGSR